MIEDYITKIKANVSIYSTKKTDNVFDGSYKSVYKGNSLNFEDLREYVVGDNIRDIDWKASSRSRTLLVKRYIAEKKHNIMLVFDTGKKMLADTKALETKKEVALMAGGTAAYIACKNGDYIGSVFNKNGMIEYGQLRTGQVNLERLLTMYDRAVFNEESGDLNKSLGFILKNIKRKMVIFVITDATGIKSVSESTLKKLRIMHDILFINISDADFTSGTSYDFDRSEHIPEFFAGNKKLMDLELKIKKELYEENEKKLIRYGAVFADIDSKEDVTEKIVELLERHKYANTRR